MSTLPLIPLDDVVVFPGMNLTLAHRRRRRGRGPARPAQGRRVRRRRHVAADPRAPRPSRRHPGRRRSRASAAASPAPPAPTSTAPCGSRSPRTTTRPSATTRSARSSASTAPSSRRSSTCATPTTDPRLPALDHRARAPSPTPPATPPTSATSRRSSCWRRSTSASGSRRRVAFQRERLAELQVRSRIRDDVQSGAEKQQREYFLRKQMDSIRKELGEDDASVADEYREQDRGVRACPTTSASTPRRSSAASSGWATSSGESSMLRTYLEWLVSVPWGERSEERLDPVHAREVLDADHAGLDDVKERITEYIAVRKLRARARRRGGGPRRGRDPHPDRPSRHRQDLDRRVDRQRDRARVRPHVARRRPRRGRDPRPPPHLHRRAAGPPRPRPARRQDDEPGDHARRGRQGRRRLARRPELGPARGARPGAEPLVPRPLPRRRARPLRGHVHRHGERRRDDPRARCSTGWRSSASTATRPRRRSRSPRATCCRVSSSATACGPTRSSSSDEVRAPGRHRVHPRGGRPQPRARARQAPAQDRDGDRQRRRPRRRWSIDAEAVRKALGRQRFFQEAAERTAVPGVATGLSVSGAGGDVLFIETTSMTGR